LGNPILCGKLLGARVRVALYFGNQPPWSSANEKGIDSLVAWLIPIYILTINKLRTCSLDFPKEKPIPKYF